MNREIKFRAWHPEWEDMLLTDIAPRFDKREFYPFEFMVGFSHYLQDDRWELMQFTGLQDKNRKDIYEGDIYLAERSHMPSRGHKKKGYPDRIKVVCVVEWSVYDAGWRPKEIGPIKEHKKFDKDTPYHYYHTSLSGDKKGVADWIEVIGNIYQHPELLKEVTNGQ